MKRILPILFLILTLLPLSQVQPATAQTVVALNAFADTYVRADAATTNYGTQTIFGSDNQPVTYGYVAFDATGQAVPTKATLRLVVTDESNDGPALYTTATGWSETAVTYNTRPAFGSGPFGDYGSVPVGTVMTFDVTSAFVQGVMSFGLQQTSSNGTDVASRENGTTGNRPQLLLEYATPPTNTPVPPTNTPVPPTNTPIPPTATNTAVPPTATNTAVPPTNTPEIIIFTIEDRDKNS